MSVSGRSGRLGIAAAVAAAALPAGAALGAPGDVTVAKVAEINPTSGASISGITDVNGIAFFKATNGATPGQSPPQFGDELYRSYGTAAGTFMVKDTTPPTPPRPPQAP